MWGIFKMLSAFIMSFTSKISPSFEFAFWTITVLSVLNGISALYNIWTIDTNYSGQLIFGAIVCTMLIVELTFALILGSASMEETYYD